MDLTSDFELLESGRRLLARWHWILVAALLGGVLGFAASALRPPVYEASAVIEIGLDRSRAEVPEEVTVRQANDRVRGLLLADDTLQRATDLAGLAPSTDDAIGELRRRIRLSESPDGWRLAVQGASADEAERLAQAWADVSLDQITQALRHALRAAEWQDALYEASCRLTPAEGNPNSAIWRCQSAPAGGADEMPAAILAEVQASRGILPVMSYALLRRAKGSAQVVLWDRGSMILGSSLSGLAIGALVAASRKRTLRG